ncbi:MAG: FtsX-like permease family protein [Thermodesulfobacteriota bacterium]|nr:FtsX-like permease family protein [Thermodesulfobacteriota bacterium]
MYFQLAWRNIWRNPRRTAVIMTAIIIGVWSMVFLNTLMRGMEVDMIKNSISTLTGHLQIHHKDYRNDPVIENSMYDTQTLETALNKVLPTGANRAARIRVNAIVGNARHTGGITLVGINPAAEAKTSFIGHAINQDRYLEAEDKQGIIVGQALLVKFETKLGRKLIVMSQDKDGNIASKAFRIIGTYQSQLQATEKQFAFVNIDTARQMLKLKKGISEVSITLPDHIDAAQITAGLKAELGTDGYQIQTWQELLPIINAYLVIFDGFIFIWSLVVFIAMGFGIVNTTLMAVFERMREFGLLKALGMKPWWIIRDVLSESFILLIMGMIIGNLMALLCVFALSESGIDLSAFAEGAEFAGISKIIFPSVHLKDVLLSNLVVVILGLLVSLYPAFKAAKFTPVEALAQT